jgi:glycine cleavage system H protein
MTETRYTKEHEWVRLDGTTATIGITDHAQQALGDLVFVELPELGRKVAAGDTCAVVESVKAASDVYTPVAGRIAEVNNATIEDPALINRDPTGEGWLFRLDAVNVGKAALMNEAEYKAFLETL